MPRDIFQAIEQFKAGQLSRERLADLHFHFIQHGITRNRTTSVIAVSDALNSVRR